MKMKRKKAFFSISAVAKMFSVHQQTIRLYEKEGLITPKRSAGDTLLFSEEDVDQLGKKLSILAHQLGMLIRPGSKYTETKKQINKMQKDMNKIFDQTQAELDKESETSKLAGKSQHKQLLTIKKRK